MSSPVADAPEPVLLIIADISGYTRYMTANAKTLAHSQTIITELVKAIITQVQLPLEVAKLEGDAVFLFCRKRDDAHSWAETRRLIGRKLLTFFRLFSEKVSELSESTTCTCNACTHIEKLRLKVVVHSGEALFHHVFNFLELAGVDVILIHRLLKNSVGADQYLLLTEAARQDVEFPEQIPLVAGVETYDDIGRVGTLIYLPDALQTPVGPPAAFAERAARSWKLSFKLWVTSLKPATRAQQGEFRHITSASGPAAQFGFRVLTFLLTPFMLPVGAIFVLCHALRASPSNRRNHQHPADCACGHHS